MINIKISNEPLDSGYCIQAAADEECGGLAVFIGTVRNKTEGRRVSWLEYECYESMALKEMTKIAEKAVELWKVKNIVIHHRIGHLGVGDTAVIIAISAPHREAAFDGCRFAIDTLKKTVPIWKKEIFDNGEQWVSSHA